jgi:DNA invertase Pin-like site-specific DNA recombinase
VEKVIEWIRVSTIGQAANDHASIPSQKTINRQTCQRFDLEIGRTFQIADVSGASVLFSPEMQEMIRLMGAPAISGVVTREFSRIIRPENFADFALLQVFVDTNCVLFLPDGPVDFRNKTGRFVGTIRAAMAGMERFEIKERIWGAKEEKRKRGELAQSSIVLPFGVGYEKSRGFFYKQEAKLVSEAARQFISGNHNYAEIAKMLGVTPRGAHLILRNPIWTGFRVIDQKRDPSAAGKYVGINGRQADRRKIDRAPEDVIRIQVIDKPLLTQEEFDILQQRMDLKQQKHWRSWTDYTHRFTYNGFLTCPICGEPIHTVFARRDYYVCKGRRTLHKCQTAYMGRDRLEKILDGLFASSLSNSSFLLECVDELLRRSTKRELGNDIQQVNAEISGLCRKRQRVIDSFIDGTIDKPERDQRLGPIDAGIRTRQETLSRNEVGPALDMEKLIAAFAPLAEWEFWTRDEKRRVLSALIPDIRVADYKVDSLGLNPTIFSAEDTRRGRDSWPPPA